MKPLLLTLCLFAIPLCAVGQTKDVSRLTGTIYDAYGAIVIGAKVTAVGSTGKIYETLSDEDGVYFLTLPYNVYKTTGPTFEAAKYDIKIRSYMFKESEIKGFIFFPSQFGKMFLDIGLEVSRIPNILIVPSPKPKQKSPQPASF